MKLTAKEFFTDIVSEYDEIIRKLVSPYPEILWSMFYYLPKEFQPKKVLELGCGSGNLTKAIRNQWSDCSITAVDLSSAMLEKTKEKVGEKHLELLEQDFGKLEVEANSFDIVMSSLSIHHLEDEEKIKLIKNVYKWIKPGGFFVFIDGIRADSNRLYEANNEHWINLAKQHGLTNEEMNEQIEHHKAHDKYPVLLDLASWLKDAGFVEVDILWRYCIWAVLQGKKPT